MCPLPITHPTFSEARHPTTIDKQTVAEVKVLYLYPMLAGCHASNDVLVLTDRGKGGIVLDPAQHVRYTGSVHKMLLMGRAPGCSSTAGPFLYPTPTVYSIV